MRSRLLLTVALLCTLAAPALAGGGGLPPAWWTLFPGSEHEAQQFGGEAVPFSVEVDLSRTRTQQHGPLHILVTAVTPKGEVVSLTSRPIREGEKQSWSGQLPAQGVVVMYVLDDGGVATSAYLRRDDDPIRLVITGDEQGSFGVSDGLCPPRTSGTCGGPRPR